MRIPSGKSRFVIFALFLFAISSLLLFGSYNAHPSYGSPTKQTGQQGKNPSSEAILTGHAIAPKLGNATAKYALSIKAQTCDAHDCKGTRI